MEWKGVGGLAPDSVPIVRQGDLRDPRARHPGLAVLFSAQHAQLSSHPWRYTLRQRLHLRYGVRTAGEEGSVTMVL